MSPLSSEDCRALLEVARRAILNAVLEKRLPDFAPQSPSIRVSAGAFVTLLCGGRLRGCVGQVENPGPLVETIARAAINAALHDFRFPPVAAEEVSTLEIEISVLSPLDPIAPEAIIVGHHGLMVVKDEYRGLLLPQVAQERRWSVQRFLEETCAKAGLPREAWREPSTQILAFTAEVFSEASLQASSGF
jgi:AmmeMemoRadiSam system protein A